SPQPHRLNSPAGPAPAVQFCSASRRGPGGSQFGAPRGALATQQTGGEQDETEPGEELSGGQQQVVVRELRLGELARLLLLGRRREERGGILRGGRRRLPQDRLVLGDLHAARECLGEADGEQEK